ncbi:hypothetical protein CC86DRAFT_80686 [Ophiobolus disseminans]|uniref:Uncharacterized protein n=1 Tax=Ophiobolus disseminans TaxID=1469910 RepID=A0A6A6ZP19_9PLEO|nr:hypothetical protein CC86DRAFT_80686 [Ophiobolus disseminans]
MSRIYVFVLVSLLFLTMSWSLASRLRDTIKQPSYPLSYLASKMSRISRQHEESHRCRLFEQVHILPSHHSYSIHTHSHVYYILIPHYIHHNLTIHHILIIQHPTSYTQLRDAHRHAQPSLANCSQLPRSGNSSRGPKLVPTKQRQMLHLSEIRTKAYRQD